MTGDICAGCSSSSSSTPLVLLLARSWTCFVIFSFRCCRVEAVSLLYVPWLLRVWLYALVVFCFGVFAPPFFRRLARAKKKTTGLLFLFCGAFESGLAGTLFLNCIFFIARHFECLLIFAKWRVTFAVAITIFVLNYSKFCDRFFINNVSGLSKIVWFGKMWVVK